MNKCHPNSWNLLKMVPGTYLLTAEIFLMWTIVATKAQNTTGQLLPWQLLPMLPWWQMFIIKKEQGKLHLTFGKNRMSKSWDIADIEFLVGGWWMDQSNFHVMSNPTFELSWGWVGVVTIFVCTFIWHSVDHLIYKSIWTARSTFPAFSLLSQHRRQDLQ